VVFVGTAASTPSYRPVETSVRRSVSAFHRGTIACSPEGALWCAHMGAQGLPASGQPAGSRET